LYNLELKFREWFYNQPFKFYASNVISVGLGPSLSIFSSDDSPSTLLLSHAVLAALTSVVTIACASSLVLTVPATFAIQRLACLLYAGTCQTFPG